MILFIVKKNMKIIFKNQDMNKNAYFQYIINMIIS